MDGPDPLANHRDRVGVSGTTEPRLHKLVHLQPNQLDLIIVDKVMLVRENVISLCNEAAAGSANWKHGKIVLDFDFLDMGKVHVIGLYGSKNVVMNLLVGLKLVSATTQLESGIYGILSEDVLYICYWHPGERLGEASRKDVSCNFIRYVVDLCDTVYVCLEDEDEFTVAAPTASEQTSSNSKSASARGRRTTKIIIPPTPLRSDIQLRTGFQIDMPRLSRGTHWFTCVVQDQNVFVSGELRFMLCESHHRLALLFPSVHPPKTGRITQEKTVKARDLPHLVQEWSKHHALSFSELPDDDFVTLLRCGVLKERVGTAYVSLIDSFHRRREEHKQKFYHLEDSLKDEEKVLQGLFRRALKLYRSICFSWEETHLATEDRDMDDLPPLGSAEAGRPLLGEVELELCRMWMGVTQASTDISFLFVGSEFHLVNSATNELIVGPAVVESVKNVTSKWAGPILFPHEFVARLKQGGPHKDFCKLQFLPNEGESAEGPIIASASIERTVCVGEGDCPLLILPCTVRVKVMDQGAEGMLRWMDMYGKESVMPQRFRADALSCVCECPEDYGDDVCQATLASVREAVMSSSPSAYFRSKFSNQKVGEMVGKYTLEFLSLQLPSATYVPEVMEACRAVYREDCYNLSSKVERLVQRKVLTLLREQRRLQLESHCRVLEQSFTSEMSEFLKRHRSPASENPCMPWLSSLSISRCTLLSRKTEGQFSNTNRGNTRFEDVELKEERVGLQFSQEVTEPAIVTWKVAELVATKQDVDELVRNPAHVIVPQCSSSYLKLMDLDLLADRLYRVIALRSGELFIFVHDVENTSLRVYLCPKVGSNLASAKPIRSFKRFDLFAFDEVSKYMALYDRLLSKVGIYRYDETTHRIEYCDINLPLLDYSGSADLTAILFIPGKRELLLIDTDCRVRVFEINQSGMIKPRTASLPGSPIKVFVSSDGSCLITIYTAGGSSAQSPTSRASGADEPQGHATDELLHDQNDRLHAFLEVQIFNLEDEIDHLKTVQVDFPVEDPASLEAAVIKFESQMHLVLLDTSKPSRGICSKVIDSLVEVPQHLPGSQLQEARQGKRGMGEEASQPGPVSVTSPALDYISMIFEKFSTSPPLLNTMRNVYVYIVLGGRSLSDPSKELGKQYVRYVESSLEKLGQRGKDLSNLHIHLTSDTLAGCRSHGKSLGRKHSSPVGVGTWIRELICLVPIQIARAENNSLRPLSNGLQLPSHLEYADAISLANGIHFGLYDAVLAHWHGTVKVISSMGKQSSGKSYLLNHLSGSLLDVAGGRCTDGVWMTVRVTDKCLYVLLDFEGLGSFERSEQEDMLLSLLNAALSNITIFNKKDFNLDKETDAVFQRFQNSISLVKQDPRLFQGLFYLAIKDVDAEDVEALENEFHKKMMHMCRRSEENFLRKMYGGNIVIATMHPFHAPEFHKSVVDLAATVEEELKEVYKDGGNLATDLKLMIAQISAKDWSPISTKRVALRLDALRKDLSTAVCSGKLEGEHDNELVNLDTLEPVADDALQLDQYSFGVRDTGLQLFPSQDSLVIGSVLRSLKATFVEVVQRKGTDDGIWHAKFEAFLAALVERRRWRVSEWVRCNTVDFQSDGEVEKIRSQALAMLADLKQKLSLCSNKCQACFLLCVLERGHPHGHDCSESSHGCASPCTFCTADPATKNSANECGDLNGHDGPHDCKERNHACGQECTFSDKSSNCNRFCALDLHHPGDHRCNTNHHLCAGTCSMSSCRNSCTLRLELGHHERHACSEQTCPLTCTFPGCNRKCGALDHFHELHSDGKHICGYEHSCHAECEAPGICRIVTEQAKHPMTFAGKRSVFEYEDVTEQNGVRERCCIAIPPGADRHEGPHRHTTEENAVHFCSERCPACGYFCHLAMGHAGLHDTVHGNMRSVSFVAEAEAIDIQGRRYAWGESGMAEICSMYCKAQGRGHIHLVRCPGHEASGVCGETTLKGVRHETRKFGPNFDEPKDEFTCSAYWNHIRFKHPCKEEDRKEFELCNHFCRSDDHDSDSAKSYCREKLWHQPVPNTEPSALPTTGYVTDDGHSFSCNHARDTSYHIIFIVDRSASMSDNDIRPTLSKIAKKHNNRLGCVYEAIVRFVKGRGKLATREPDLVSVILFNSVGTTVLERQLIKKFAVEKLLSHYAGGWTDYCSGLHQADYLLRVAAKDNPPKCPVLIFLSDGENFGPHDPITLIESMKTVMPKLVLHTILFGNDRSTNLLENMASAARGTFKRTIDEVQLSKSFEDLAGSLVRSTLM